MEDKEINSYNLSRNWFDFCFENPELIKPTHIALYFFAVEHCNRLGWKEKFGLPTQMAMDAIGVKNWRTYSSAFNDIVNWGYFKVHEKSKNQYSATVIAIVKNTKATTKALSKAIQKHSQKQSSSIAVIDKLYKPITNKPNNQIEKTWRTDFEIYKSELLNWFEIIKTDYDYLKEQEKFNPGIDVILSIEKSIKVFWGTEAGWKNKKNSKTVNIDWKSTIAKNLDKNKVYKQNEKIRSGNGRDFNSPETSATIESIKRQLAEAEQERLNAETLQNID